MLIRVGLRLVSIVLLLVALVFVVALMMELGRTGGLGALPTAIPEAAGFTLDYLTSLAQGDLGTIASRYVGVTGTSVTTELARALPISLGLLGISLVLAVVVGLGAGMASALRRNSRFAGFLLFVSALGVSTPAFFAAMLLIWLGVWLFGITGTHWFPIAGFGWDAHLLLPALVLAARPMAAVTRLSYHALVEILEAEYVRTAHGKGLPRSVIWTEHVLRNAAVPILTTVGVSLRFALAALPLVEYIFSWPGIGRALLAAIQVGDTTAAIGFVLPLALLFVLVNVLLELLYPVADARLRSGQAGAA